MSLIIDQVVSKQIWNGKLPIQISLDPTESRTFTEPIFTEAARCSYLPLITEQLAPIYSGLDIDLTHTDVWYDYQGEPLKWHYPIGLLYDMSGSKDRPWHITVHFQNFPTDKLLMTPSVEATQNMFMSMVKQADFIRHGSTKRVMNLSKNDQSQLWQALSLDRYDDYWNVNMHLLADSEGLRYVPLRIYLPDQCPVIQENVSFTDEGNPKMLGDVLGAILPDLFPSSLAIPMTHGIQLPLDTPIGWASQNLSFADNFLHVVICKCS
ncbi:autophagy protein Apg5-domain-containing protein [Zychaea mexicana]|uniref:autophagy protein Apg5-domain-containing protein n=1 Tax=Zychaea mexicana TaxID=64656 RepID=UPI0022FE0752|nr:autophagy protein Apg5-domain-containing protein [Zychaea mexicana]KAI9492838.1 autophagy protein Apg5-domain-containing protein [Zychaea mexicana]